MCFMSAGPKKLILKAPICAVKQYAGVSKAGISINRDKHVWNKKSCHTDLLSDALHVHVLRESLVCRTESNTVRSWVYRGFVTHSIWFKVVLPILDAIRCNLGWKSGRCANGGSLSGHNQCNGLFWVWSHCFIWAAEADMLRSRAVMLCQWNVERPARQPLQSRSHASVLFSFSWPANTLSDDAEKKTQPGEIRVPGGLCPNYLKTRDLPGKISQSLHQWPRTQPIISTRAVCFLI